MKKIIFFDIDGTLFNVPLFISLFHENLIDQFGFTNQDVESLKALYDQVKKEQGYFLPSLFLDKINNNFPSVNREELDKSFHSIDLFEKSVYKDTSNIKSLANLAILGIFSQGDENFQKKKIDFMSSLLDRENIYIFPNKVNETKQIFDKYIDFDIYLVDNDLSLLLEVRKINPSVNVILIDRNGQFNDNKDITNIKDLNELESVL